MKSVLTLAILLFLLPYLSAQPNFKYGNANANYPSLIKNDGNNVYILGQEDKNGTSYGTITKLDASSGNIIWQKELDFPSQINDMVFIPPQGALGKTSLYIVGHTLPFDINNASFVAQINSETAALECSNIFDQTGRESFRKIVRNMNTPNPNFPYFILGTRGYSGGAVTQEKTILINLRNGCAGGTNVNFVKEYNFANSPDLEFSRGMAVLNDGSILLMGNETANGFGMIVKINGAGNMQNAVVYTRDMEVLDATELANGNILFSGKVNTNGISSAILFATDIKLSVLGRAAENKNILSYPFIETDFNGGVYLPCYYKPMQNSNTTTYPLVQRLNIGGTINSPLFTLPWQVSLENSNPTTSYQGVALSIGDINSITYTDGRNVSNSNLDFTFAKTNLSFSAPCADSVVTFLTPLELGFNNVEVTNVASSLPSPTTGNLIGLDWVRGNFCAEPCKLDFSMSVTERECNDVLCNINITNGTPVYTISWDFECDGDVDANGLQGQYTFPSSGAYQVCIKVLDGMECIKEKMFSITTNGDSEAPNIICPASTTIACNDSTDPSNTGQPTVTDNTDPNPVISPPSDIITQNTPCLKKIVRTWTAKDDCNNESTCTQVITIEDKIEPIITGCGRKIEVQGIKDANGKCKEKVTLLAPTVTDQCDANSTITNTYTSTNNATADYFEGTTIVTWTATDQCENTAMCRDTIIVLGCDSTCCINQQEFIDRVENAVAVNLNTDDCIVSLNLTGLLSCDKVVKIVWGDGDTDNAPFNNVPMHSYNQNGNYEIKIFFVEYNDQGNGCFEKSVSKKIDINCCECGSIVDFSINNQAICIGDKDLEWSEFLGPIDYKRRYHTSIWTGNEIIFHGGAIGDQANPNIDVATRNGMKYSPNSNTWTPINSGSTSPINRYNHFSHWTGEKMIVWGGYLNSTTQLTDGGIYDPQSDSWTGIPATSINDIWGCTTVFTGQELIVWGENPQKYNPINNQWTIIAPNNTLSPYGSFNVWTGTEMLVWGGGILGSGTVNAGGKYNPLSNSWQAISINNGPIAAMRGGILTHGDAVWADGKMYIFGGRIEPFSTITYSNQFFSYDPANDTWQDLTNPDIQVPENLAKLFWTGKEIVLLSYATDHDQAFIFNPKSKSWQNITTSVFDNTQNNIADFGGAFALTNDALYIYSNINLTNSGKILNNLDRKPYQLDLQCNNSKVDTIPCPLTNWPHKIIGEIKCKNGCKPDNIEWELVNENNQVVVSGVSPSDNLAIPIELNNVNPDGLYTIKINNGCGAQECTCEYKFRIENCITNTENGLSFLNDISIHPNPTTGLFDINIANNKGRVKGIQIIDAVGKNITHVPIIQTASEYSVDLSSYSNGMYFVRVSDTNGAPVVKKIIKID